MPQVINTNIASLNAQRNLNKSQGMLSTSLQRLSSGMRINSAKDDAAGLAISERFTAQIRGLNQAARNSNDGISLAQTGEGALGEVTNNLQRIRELAVQAANATNSASDRIAMQQEVSQLINEIDRVATTSNFNGVQLLDGPFTGQTFQVGANVGETISVASIVDATKAGLGLDNSTATSTAGGALTAALSAGDLIVNGVEVGAAAQDAQAIAAAGITTSGTFAGGDRTFTAADGRNIVISEANTGDSTAAAVAAGTGTQRSTISSVVSTGENLTIAGATGAAAAGLTVENVTATGNTLTVETVAGSNALIGAVDSALGVVNSSRATLGAVQNRFESVITSLQTSAESLSAARSRIQDTDFAAETANLTKAQILQQAGMSMLAQANSLPQNVMSLLQG
jgi:flagellin